MTTEIDLARKEAEIKVAEESANAEQQAADREAVARMDAEVERRRVADKAHRARIEKEALTQIDIYTGNVAMASAILEAIKSGRIPHLTIKY